jgi:hypothetical protein
MAQRNDLGHDEGSSSSFVPPSRPSPLPPAFKALDSVASSSIPPRTPTLPAVKPDHKPNLSACSSSAPVANGSSGGAVVAAAPTSPALNSPQDGSGRGPEPGRDMSNHHHYPGGPGNHQHGQPAHHYATSSAAAYAPSPAVVMSPGHYTSYPPGSVTTQPGDAYRPGAVMSNPMSLPSMRTIDPVPQHPGAPHMAHSPVGMGAPGGMPFYPHAPLTASPSYGLHPDPMARYPLPHDPRLIGSRGPKKEIKRRTKTGCLTCRKRRIKCDETHPTCNNCKKSKRDCLGYDPVFNRSQPGPGQSTSPLATTHPLIGPGGVVQASPASQPTTPSAASAPINLPSSATAGPRQTATYNAQPPFLSSSSSSSYPAVANHSPTPTPIATPTSTASTTAVGYDPSYHSAASTTPSLKNDPCYQLSPAGPDPSFRMLPSTSMHDNSRMLDSRLISDHNSHLRGGAPSA